MSKVIVFDFDKTLTYSDTLFGFFWSVTKINFFKPFKFLLYFLIMLFAKLKVLSNSNMKRIGIVLFLKGIDKAKLKLLSVDYSRKIKLNKLYHNFDFTSSNEIYIISASFTNYLKPLFQKNVTVLGSEFIFKDDKISGLNTNCYGAIKARILADLGVSQIDVLYTDSYSDLSLALIANNIKIVNGDKIYECKNIEAFKSYFNKN